MTDIKLIRAIAERAAALYESIGVNVKPEYIMTELRVVHDEIVPLRLADLLQADDFNLVHDVGGIHNHLDIPKRKLTGCFMPRYAETRH